MKEFIRKYDDRIHGVLSCFDRMLFRGYLPIMSGSAWTPRHGSFALSPGPPLPGGLFQNRRMIYFVRCKEVTAKESILYPPQQQPPPQGYPPPQQPGYGGPPPAQQPYGQPPAQQPYVNPTALRPAARLRSSGLRAGPV